MPRHSFKLEAALTGLSVCGRTVPFGPPAPKVRPFLAIDTVHAFMAVHETLPSQKDMDAPRPVPDPYGHLFHPHAQQFIATALGPIQENTLAQQYELAATPDGDVVLHPYIFDHPALSGRPQNFFSKRPVGSVCPDSGRRPVSSAVRSPPGSSAYAVRRPPGPIFILPIIECGLLIPSYDTPHGYGRRSPPVWSQLRFGILNTLLVS